MLKPCLVAVKVTWRAIWPDEECSMPEWSPAARANKTVRVPVGAKCANCILTDRFLARFAAHEQEAFVTRTTVWVLAMNEEWPAAQPDTTVGAR